jgi:hypothetical protein
VKNLSSLPKKRAFNLLLNEMIVLEAREPSGNLSATVETLLIEFVTRQEDAKAAIGSGRFRSVESVQCVSWLIC